MGSTLFRDPQARSSALAALGSLQPRAFGSLNRVDPLDSVSNYYVFSPPKRISGGSSDPVTPEVALTPHPWLAFRGRENPGGVGDGRAESAWTTIANGLDSSYINARGNSKIEGHTWK